jgi:hypothetical protein
LAELVCAKCGHPIKGPWCFGAEAPWRQLGIAEADFPRRVELTESLMVVDGRHFFIRGHIEVPINGTNEPLCWSVWCSVSEASFRHIND